MSPPAYFRRRMGRSQNGAGPAGSSGPGPARGRSAAASRAGAALGRAGAAPLRAGASPPWRAGGAGWRAGTRAGGWVLAGRAGNAGRRGGGGACRPADESAQGPP